MRHHILVKWNDTMPQMCIRDRHTDTAMAGTGTQFILGIAIVLGTVSVQNVRNLVQQVSIIEAQGFGADHVIRVEIPHTGHNQKFSGAGFVVGLALIGKPRGNQERGVEMPLLKKV